MQERNQRHAIPKEDPPFGMDSVIFNYVQRSRKEYKVMRTQFRKVQGNFTADLARRYPKRLESLGIEQDEIAAMRQGHLPHGFQIRHIKPLEAKGSTNDFENLVLVPKLPYGAAIHNYLAPQLQGLRVGRERQVKLPLPRSPIFKVPASAVKAITSARHENHQRRLDEEERREQVRAEKRAEREAKQERKREEKRLREEHEEEEARKELQRMVDELKEAWMGTERFGLHGGLDVNTGHKWEPALVREAAEFDETAIAAASVERKRRRDDRDNRSGKGKQVILHSGPMAAAPYGMPLVEVEYTARIKKFVEVDGQKVDMLRYQGLVAKREFLKMLAEKHGPELKAAYKLTDCEVDSMKEGFTPEGLSVHHKMPLGGCGDPLVAARANDFSNMILIPMEPYHNAIHEYLNPQISDMKRGSSRKVRLPMPEGMWFKPTVEYKRSGPPKGPCGDQPEASNGNRPNPEPGRRPA
jgi:hypothetical protein